MNTFPGHQCCHGFDDDRRVATWRTSLVRAGRWCGSGTHGLSTALVFVAILAAVIPSPAEAEWIQVGTDIDGEADHDSFGGDVALSSDGTRVAVGGSGNDANGQNSGHVRVFRLLNSAWIQMGSDIDGEAAFDGSGASVRLSADGSRVAIGAPHNGDGGHNSGHVRVYEWHIGTQSWLQLGQDLDGDAVDDYFGHSVSLSANGDRLAVGARFHDGNGADSGLVRVYRWLSPYWVQMGSDLLGELAGDNLGFSVELSDDGTRVAIGGHHNSASGIESGHARVYRWHTTTAQWLKVGADLDGDAPFDRCGSAVALSEDGSRVAVGATGHDGGGANAGQVRVYQWVSPDWVQMGADIFGEDADDEIGGAIALSADGSHLAIGSLRNDDVGTLAGHVRVFRWNAGSAAWEQVDLDIDADAPDEYFGGSVALADDGLTVAAGAPSADGVHLDSGVARVFALGIFADGFETGDTLGWSTTSP